MAGVRGRKRKKLGPLVLNLVSDGFLSWRVSSWGVEIGRWSWNSRTERHRVDLPGPWSWTGEGPRSEQGKRK